MFDLLTNITNEYFLKSVGSIRSDTFNLNYFKTLDQNDFMAYADWTLERLGFGSSRVVFILSSTKVLKVARNDAGAAQNQKEKQVYDTFDYLNLLTKVYDADANSEWLISELVKPLNNDEDFFKAAGFPIKALEFYINDPSLTSRLNDKQKELINNLTKLANMTSLVVLDFFVYTSWGTNASGELRLLDSGYDNQVYGEHYVEKQPVPTRGLTPEQIKEEERKQEVLIEKLREERRKQLNMTSPYEALKKAKEEGHSDDLQEIACHDPETAYMYAKNIPDSNVYTCAKAVIKDPRVVYNFMMNVEDAPIGFLSDYLIRDKTKAFYFLKKRPEYIGMMKDKPAWENIVSLFQEVESV